MLNLEALDLEQIAESMADQTDYDHQPPDL